MNSPRRSSGAGELLSIQYLRAFAALMVVAFHATRQTAFKFEIGASGVDVFFIISGFILWTIASERQPTPFGFLIRRIQRVAPLYWLLTLAVTAACAVWPGIFFDAKPTVSHVLLSLAFISHMNPDGGPFPVITDGWTLNYEAIFYVIFTAVLFAPRRWRLALMTAALIALPVYGYFIRQDAYIMGANMHFLQFAAGVWLAEARLRGILPERRTGIVLAGLGAALFVLLQALSVEVYFWRPIIWGTPALLLVAGLVSVEADGGLPQVRWLHGLGDASYSIYLCHFLFISLLAQFLRSGADYFPPIAFAGGLAAGLVCYVALERPLLTMLHRPKLGFLPSRAI
jgi:exopolysaccharide production protein ExoZ